MLIILVVAGCTNVQVPDDQLEIGTDLETDEEGNDDNSQNDIDDENYVSLYSLPDEYPSQMAKEDGCVVWSHNEVYNLERLHTFIDNIENDTKDMIRVVSYTKEGDAIIKDLDYTQGIIRCNRDSTRDKFSANPNISTTIYNKIIIEKWYSEHYKGDFTEYMLIGDKDDKELLLQSLQVKELGADENDESGLEILAKIFPNEVGFTWWYHGYAEYGHIMTIEDISSDDDSYNYKIKGYMNDGVEDPDPNGSRTFTIEYKIDGTSITEYIYNNEHNSNTLNSIISNKTILKLPLEEGNSWEDTFSYNGEKYTATSVLEEIVLNIRNGELQEEYVVRTKVNDIEGYPNNTYEEKCVYRIGTGLVAFSNTTINGMPFTEDDPFSFGYGLSFTEIVQD